MLSYQTHQHKDKTKEMMNLEKLLIDIENENKINDLLMKADASRSYAKMAEVISLIKRALELRKGR